MRNVVQLLRQRRVIAIALVTLVTLGLVGVVVAATTSVGCSLAKSLAVKSAKCVQAPVAVLVPSSPTPTPSPLFFPNNPPTNPPDNPGSSNIPPNNPGASSIPPYNPGSSAGDPFAGPASLGFPPMVGPASPSAGLGVSLSCRLPIYAGGPGSGGFIVFPGGTFVADPRSAVTAPSPSPGTASPAPAQYGPGYAGWWGTTYDAKFAKWLPVPWAWVSPDGSHYAYPLNGDIYVQSVSGGAQLDLGEGQKFSVLDVENNGVYATQPPQAGLWFLPFSGATKQITTTGFWQAASHGAAYGTATSAVPQGVTNTVLKLDLATGASTPFFSQPGGQSMVTGFDAQGRPTVQVNYTNGVALFIATGPETYTAIAGLTYGGYNPNPFPQGPPIADAHGLWFSVGNFIVLYANGSWYGMTNIGGQLAGQCL
jgi:hypothetical protein